MTLTLLHFHHPRFVQNPAFWGPKSRHGRPPVPKPDEGAAPDAAAAAPPPHKLSKGMIKRMERREEERRKRGLPVGPSIPGDGGDDQLEGIAKGEMPEDGQSLEGGEAAGGEGEPSSKSRRLGC